MRLGISHTAKLAQNQDQATSLSELTKVCHFGGTDPMSTLLTTSSSVHVGKVRCKNSGKDSTVVVGEILVSVGICLGVPCS